MTGSIIRPNISGVIEIRMAVASRTENSLDGVQAIGGSLAVARSVSCRGDYLTGSFG
jgi:hypothetical protein